MSNTTVTITGTRWRAENGISLSSKKDCTYNLLTDSTLRLRTPSFHLIIAGTRKTIATAQSRMPLPMRNPRSRNPRKSLMHIA